MRTVKLFALSTVISVPVLFAMYRFMDSPQCPFEYTQQQIETSDCIVGANIGLGLFIMLAPIIWVLTTIAIVFARKYKSQKRKR